MYRKYFKRLFDLVFAFLAIILFSPIYLISTILILLIDGRPIIFKQDRVGLNKKHFNIFKFKTMRPGPGLLLSYDNDPRVTRLGRILRKYKIDELPQLFNVAIGDMSIVGPRPEVPKFAQKRFGKKFDIIFSVRPGITGLSSVKFINEAAYFPKNGKNRYQIYFQKILPKKITLDIKYINNIGFINDLKIIVATFKSIIS